eukprot:TRINITY_DN2101_c0_g1_i1.p1 TRINITY_DN2101_c0_g1~~TRINITY_DN2101_c0_g1_i1.p1  ORF type:complete len:236 (+),score=22.42 TRINITY_DN2101_c0_g1_i1:393-1100(+)
MVTTFLRGIPVSDVYDSLTREQVKKFARDLGDLTKQVHQVIPEKDYFSTSRWANFIHERREQCISDLKNKWESLPAHLIEQIEEYLPQDMNMFLKSTPSCAFLHCDISKEHVLMSQSGDGTWNITGLLDWGDVRYGDPYYELPVIHVDHWQCDKELLKEFVIGYNTRDPGSALSYSCSPSDFSYRSMVYLLLFEFNCFQNLYTKKGVFCIHPEWKDCKTLEELAMKLWDFTSEGC